MAIKLNNETVSPLLREVYNTIQYNKIFKLILQFQVMD